MIKSKLSKYWQLLILFGILSCNPTAKKENKQPNILLIFADDLTFNSIRALGNKEVKTPNLDRLVNSSVSFSNSYNMGGWGGAVCIASRTMMFTGKFLWDAQKADSLFVTDSYLNPLLSELLNDAGYDTYMSGKWHIKKPAKDVFKYAKNIRPGMPNQTPQGYNRPLNENDTLWKPWDKSKQGFWKGGKHWSEVLGDDAIGFIDSAKTKENPFFMYLAFNAPHDPRQSPKEFVDQYPLESISIPKNFLPEYPYKEEMGAGKNLRDERLAPFPRTEYSVKVNIQEYYAIISHMDQQIGRILEALETSNLLDDTYIIFSADHGLAVGQHGLMGKQNMYDHSLRVPLLISGPNVPKNKSVKSDVYIQDIMPSILELANINKPSFVDFNSLIPFLTTDNNKSNYSEIYGAYINDQRMIRKNDYKLIVYPKAKKVRLFNVKDDPNEMHDLSYNKNYDSIKTSLFNDLQKLQIKMKDKLELDENYL
ncbi:MAG: sulfatase-like hydrolase/transferase [Ignavibacteriales bacterium]|nr:sulfatase-like hydrolase/transferase [Ignavibacteriales bacterium]